MFFRLLCHACYVCELCALLGMVTMSPHILCVELAGEKAKAPHLTGSYMCASVLPIPLHGQLTTERSCGRGNHARRCAVFTGHLVSVSGLLYICLHSRYRFHIAKSFPFDATVCGRLVCVHLCTAFYYPASFLGKKYHRTV